MVNLYKKSEAGLTILLVIIVIVLFLGWLINLSQRECKSNRDCGSEAYCGSDFSCHSYPTIQKTVVQYNLFWPALIIGLAIVIAAIIFKWDKIMSKEIKQKENFVKEEKIDENLKLSKESKEVEEISEPYYKSNNLKTP